MREQGSSTAVRQLGKIMRVSLGLALGIPLAVAGEWFINDGLLSGFYADEKETGIGIACTLLGTATVAICLRQLLEGRRVARWAGPILVLCLAAALGGWRFHQHATRGEWVVLGREERTFVMNPSTRKLLPALKDGVRPPRWYETEGMTVLVVDNADGTAQWREARMPMKYVLVSRK